MVKRSARFAGRDGRLEGFLILSMSTKSLYNETGVPQTGTPLSYLCRIFQSPTVAPDTYQGFDDVHFKFPERHEPDVQHPKRNAQCGPRNGRQCKMCGWEDLRFCAQVVTHPRRETITLRISHCGNMKGTGKSCNFAASFFHE